MQGRPGGAGALLVALLLSGCAGTEPAGRPSVPTVAGVELIRPGSLPRLPLSGPPLPLRAGTYVTPDGFEPVLSLEVPGGWWGGGTPDGWSVGRGNDEVRQRYRDAGILVEVLDLAYDDAVAVFRSIDGLTHERDPLRHQVAGRPATTFWAHAAAEPVILDALGRGADVGPHGWSQTFVEVGATRTLLIRTEVVDDTAAPAVRRVLESLDAP